MPINKRLYSRVLKIITLSIKEHKTLRFPQWVRDRIEESKIVNEIQ